MIRSDPSMSRFSQRGIRAVALGLFPCLATAQFATSNRTEDPAPQVWIDYDEDGLLDLYATATGREDVLLQNLGDGSFANVTVEAGLAGNTSTSAFTADYDEDTRTDLLLVTSGGGLRLFRATGSSFQEVTAEAGLAGVRAAVRADWIDYDQDGWGDLWVERSAELPVFFHNESGLSFQRVDLGLPEAPALETIGVPVIVEDVPVAGSVDAGRRAAGGAGGGELTPPGTPPSITRRSLPHDPAFVGVEDRWTQQATIEPLSLGSTLPLLFSCLPSIRDQAGGCLMADSTPTLGRLYPQTVDLNVHSGSGFVGMGVAVATEKLDVRGNGTFLSGGGNNNGKGAVKGENDATPGTQPVRGYLGVDGDASFDGIATLSHFSDLEIGVLGVVDDATATDNIGVLGHSDGVGVRGEYAGSPTTSYGELGAGIGVGVRGSGSMAGGEFLNDVHLVNSGLGLITMDLRESDAGGSSISMYGDGGGQTMYLDSDWGFAGYAQQFFFNAAGSSTINLDSGTDGGGSATFTNNVGVTTIELDGENGLGGSIEMFNDAGIETLEIYSSLAGGSYVALRNSAGSTTMDLSGDANDGGWQLLRAADGSATVSITGESTNSAGEVSVRNDLSQETIELLGEESADSGQITLWDRAGSDFVSVVLDGRDSAGTGSELLLSDSDGTTTIDLDGQNGNVGQLSIYETDGSVALNFSGCDLNLYNSAGSSTINYDRCVGTKSAVVDMPSYGQRLFYTMESPEIWFEDFGSGQLVNGEARIDLDPVFLEGVTISAAHPIKVFITLTDESQGIYVRKGLDHFVARELNAGTGNATFDWRVVAKRRGLEQARLEPFEDAVSVDAVVPEPVRTPSDGPEGRVEEVQYAPKAPEPQRAAAAPAPRAEPANRLGPPASAPGVDG